MGHGSLIVGTVNADIHDLIDGDPVVVPETPLEPSTPVTPPTDIDGFFIVSTDVDPPSDSATWLAGEAFTDGDITIPTFVVNSYFGIATTHMITFIIQPGVIVQDLTSMFSQRADILINGESYNVWYTLMGILPRKFRDFIGG